MRPIKLIGTVITALAVGFPSLGWAAETRRVVTTEERVYTTDEKPAMTRIRTGTWSGGGGVGFLAETPDNTAFGVNLHADRFLSEYFSVGPLAQFAFTNDLALYALSAQGKYWIPLGQDLTTKIFLQGGVGIVHAAFQLDDTTWIVPLGIGVDHAFASGPNLYAAFLLNVTDINTGRGTKADVMPGVTFGVRF